MITMKGLIINERPCGETSKIITVLSAEKGIIDIYVRGGIKSKKTSSTTQKFIYAIMSIEEKTDNKGYKNYYLNSVETENMFYNLRLDPKKVALASYFSELLCYSRIESKGCTEILRLTLNSFYYLNNGERSADLLKSIFEFRLLCEIGFRPYLVGCSHCYNYEDDEMHFNLKTGLLECHECCINKNSLYNITFDKKLLYIIRHISLTDFDRLFNIRISDVYQIRLSDFTESFIRYHFKNDFAALRFYKLI